MTDTLAPRQIRDKSELSRYVKFSGLQYTDPVIHPDGSVEQTVGYMKDIVKKNYKSVESIADKLWSESNGKLSRFLRGIFDFVMNYVQYEKDSAFMEQLRLPLRTLHDQRGDCDCMSILIGAILYAKGVPFKFRITKYNGRSEFQHVYVVVEHENGYTVIDPVIREFNKEKPFDEKKDFHVSRIVADSLKGLNGMPIQMLNGTGNAVFCGVGGVFNGYTALYGDIMHVVAGTDLLGLGLGEADDDEAAIHRYLIRTRDVILAKPEMFKAMRNPLEVARMLDYAIRYWDSPQIDNVLGILEREEQRLLSEGKLYYPRADLEGSELGDLGKGFFKKIKNAVKKGVKKVASVTKKVVKKVVDVHKKVAKKTFQVAKKVGKAVGKAAKAVGKVLAKFNPVSLMIRGGLLLAIRTNMFKLADKLQYGLYTDEQAQAAGFNMDLFHDNQQSYKKALNVFTKLQGNESKFRAAIQKGVKHKAIKGVSGLGMLTGLGWIATAATVVSAMSAIIGILSFFKGKKNPMGEEYADEPVSEDAIKSAMDAAGNLDEDGNPIDSEGNIIDDAANVVNNVVNKVQDYLPSGGGSSDDGGGNDNNVYDAEPSSLPVKKAAAPKVIGENIPELRKSAMDVIKENAKPIAIGAGILGLAAAFFLLRRKKTKSAGLSGVRTSKRRSYNKLETIKLS